LYIVQHVVILMYLWYRYMGDPK